MNRLLLILAVIVLMASCTSPGTKNENQSSQVITVSILPQKTFVEKIAGKDFDIQVLVPEGASPETYTLLPSQLKQISRSAAWFMIGHIGFELSLQDRIKELNRNMVVVDQSKGLNLIRGAEEQHGDHTHPGGVDPHIWLSPRMVKQMVVQITETLSEINPEKSSEYKVNQQKFIKEIDQLDAKIRNSLKDYQGRSFITFHPSLSYFARDYGLVQYSLENEGKEPTAQHLARVVDLARKEKIKSIYIQNEFDIDHAKVFAEEIKGKIIEVRPLSPEWEDNLLILTQMFLDNF